MQKSLFIEYVNKYMPGIVVKVVNKLNDSERQPSYLHRAMLRKEFSATGKWEALTANNTLIAADVVAMDSSLPLKKRDVIHKASGDIPKMGMELYLNEKQLTELDTLVAIGGTEQQLLQVLFADTPKVISGVYERCEYMFLQALSSGVTLVEDSENVGTGVRVDFGLPTSHKFGVTALWSVATADPIADIERAIDQATADGKNITKVLMDKTAFNNFAKNEKVKQMYAFYANAVVASGATIPTPSVSKISEATADKWGFVIEIVDRSIRVEKNGVQKSVKAWADGAVVLLANEQVGSLTYARLAEQNHPIEGVSYEVADDYILVSKYRHNRPSLSEFTNSQARVLPVISNVDDIYILNTKELQG